ncbi:MAG: protoporphyrinogen oxidase [Prevotellaceae bacterium]|nr:protoporphyrinogen oxidase [Prevotella sp.]MDD7257924.1 protoporphyrinogen oxidase [Prevotellaceae bacterium]MDY6129685.1 protoporphyrinogen oxidase [Prevotella sp.]
MTNGQEERTADVVVIGAGLTGLTAAFHLKRKGCNVLVLEKENRIGGQIQTHRTGEFVMESGPNTGVVSCPEVAELFQLLEQDCDMEYARESSKRRLIWKGHTFRDLPSGLVSGLRTPLFTWRDKLRLLGEPFRAKGTHANETVGELTVRRLGRSYLDYAVDPFLSGVYAGDPMRLVTRFALPKLYRLEQNHGSFIRGAIAKSKEPKSERDRLATKKVFSARGGLGNMVEALGKGIGAEQMVLGADNITVNPNNGGWDIVYKKNGHPQTVRGRKVLTTCGAYALPALLPFIDYERMAAISALAYAPVIQVSVGIKDTRGVHCAAFGGLVPSCEHQNVLGILFPSACFEERAPQKGALLSFFMGGVRHLEWMEKSDEELKGMVDDALHRMLKLPEDVHADAIRIFRHPLAIPQYEKSSEQRYAAIESIERQYPGLFLAGNIKGGIGMADRIRQGTEMASLLTLQTAGQPPLREC